MKIQSDTRLRTPVVLARSVSCMASCVVNELAQTTRFPVRQYVGQRGPSVSGVASCVCFMVGVHCQCWCVHVSVSGSLHLSEHPCVPLLVWPCLYVCLGMRRCLCFVSGWFNCFFFWSATLCCIFTQHTCDMAFWMVMRGTLYMRVLCRLASDNKTHN